jgi:hypothetical protein
MPSCPTCGKNFDKQKSVNKHHYPAHGFSIATDESNCVECGNSFEYYPSEKPGKYCKSCVDEGYGNENLVHGTGKNNTNWKGGFVDSSCSNCDKDISVKPSNFERYSNNFCSTSCQSNFKSEQFSGKGNPRYIDGQHRQRNYGTGWRRAKRKALERDNHSCVVCNKGKEELGRKPAVHHKKPVRTFDEPEDAHFLENLVCLCPKHHQEVEAGNRKI